jgi:hypothetical protein
VTSVRVIEGRAIVIFDDGTIAVITAVPRELASLLAVSPPVGQSFAVGAHGALWLMVIGNGDMTRQASALARSSRTIDADELAELRPVLFDVNAPRALWPG